MHSLTPLFLILLQNPGQPPPPQPPSHYSHQELIFLPAAMQGDSLACVLSIDTIAERLFAKWSFTRGSDRVFAKRQAISVDFWPTACATVGEDVVVCGRDKNLGGVAAHRLTFQYPPIPSSGNTYAPSPTITQVAFWKRNNQKEAHLITELHGGPDDEIVIYYNDSHRIYSLNLATKQRVLLFTPATVPPLGAGWMFLSNGEHLTQGYIYSLRTLQLGSSTAPPLVFFDTNKDGSIDSWEVVEDQAEWDSLFGTVNNWVRLP